jgi:rhodanese-related sulfurtransferase
MRNRKFVVIVSMIMTMAFVTLAFGESVVPSDERKKISTGKYLTALQAYEMWKATPDKVSIIDVRTPEEYVYVGHPRMAINIPWQVWTGKYDTDKKDVVLDKNPNFVTETQKRYKPDDTLAIMCRSGHRSAPSCEALIQAGFKNVYNVIDGFEGDKVSDPESSYKGLRMKNGWRNSGCPWTYDTEASLMPSLSSK